MLLQNLNQNPRTLLPKFYGLYCIQCGGVTVRVVVMNNVLPRAMKMHYKYDLKGSSYKRRASRKERAKHSPTFKDLDFQEMHDGLHFDPDTYNALMKTLQRDCRVGSHKGLISLSSEVMMLVGVVMVMLVLGILKFCYRCLSLLDLSQSPR